MKIRANLELKVILISIFWGFLLGSFILELDHFISKHLLQKENIILFVSGDLITRIVIYFLSMSFVLLIKILYDTESILKYKSDKDAEDFIELFAFTDFCIAVYSGFDNGNKFIIKALNNNAQKIENVTNDVIGREIREVFPGVEQFGLYDVIKRVYLTGVAECFDTALYIDKKRYGWRKNYVFKNISGDVVCLYQDNSKLVESERKLKEKGAVISVLEETISFFLIIVDKNGIVKSAFGNLLKDLFDEKEDLIGKKIDLLFAENNKFLESFNMAREGLNFSSQISFSGKVYNVTYTGFSTKGGIVGDIAISGVDLSREAVAQMDIGRLETAISQSDEIVMITDINGVIQYVNPAFEKITGYSVSEVIGKNASFLKSGKHDQLFYKNLWNTISNGNVWRGHFFNRKKNGSIYEEDSVISPVKNQKNEIINYVAVKRDISKEVELQRQLIQAQKMEAIGRLAGGIAHDFNNILTAILGYSDLALSICKNDESLRDAIEQIKNAGKRASTLTKQLLAFTRKQVLNFEIINMKEVISEMQEMLKKLIGEEVLLSFNISDKNLIAKCDRGQIEQVILNLVINARDALPQFGGKINVTIDRHQQKAPYDFGGFNASSGEYIQLTVQDNGCGMSDEVKQKIFDPFFTTKPKGKGTGLGLATVYEIVKQHNGFITFESVLNQGTTFNVFIPAASDSQLNQKRNDTGKSEKTFVENFENKIVLVAEDDKTIQMLVSSYLSKEGYKVLLASDGLEAKQILVQRGNEINFVLLDIVMPFLDGGKLAEYILKAYPEIKIILMSGYPDMLESQEEYVKKLPILQKPFSQVELKKFIDEHFFAVSEKIENS